MVTCNDPMRIVVIGGAVVDAIHRPIPIPASDASTANGPLRASKMLGTSTPCSKTTSFGGVGRNIAEACSRLLARASSSTSGDNVLLVSVVADDSDGAALVHHAQAVCGIDTRFMARIPVTSSRGATEQQLPISTASYTAVLDGTGELCVASAAMDIFDRCLTPELVLGRSDVRDALASASCVVLEGNVPQVTLSSVLHFLHRRREKGEVVVAYDPISSHKVLRCVTALHMMDVIKPNLKELLVLADALFAPPSEKKGGLEFHTPSSLKSDDVSAMFEAMDVSVWQSHLLQRRSGRSEPSVNTGTASTASSLELTLKRTLAALLARFPTLMVACTMGPLGSVLAIGATSRWAAPSLDHSQLQQIRASKSNNVILDVEVCSAGSIWFMKAPQMDPVTIKKVTGAGDSFFSALLIGLLAEAQIGKRNHQGAGEFVAFLEELVNFSNRAAALALTSSETISPALATLHVQNNELRKRRAAALLHTAHL